MNKIGVLFLALFLSLGFVSAIETTLKQEYKPGETLIAEISGNFINPLSPEDIQFYSDRLYVPMVYDIVKIDNKYNLYALLQLKERNYTLIIKNAKFTEQGEEKEQDLEYNFVTKGNITAFQVSPGIIVSDKDFKVQVTAFKNVKIEANFLNNTQQVSLIDGQTSNLNFPTEGIDSFKITQLSISGDDSQYTIPVVLFKNETKPLVRQSELRFLNNRFNFSLVKGDKLEFEVFITVVGEQNITDIKFNSTIPLIINPENISRLNSGEVQKINVTISAQEVGNISGTLNAFSNESIAEAIIDASTYDTISEIPNSTTSYNPYVSEDSSCSQLSGTICQATEECKGTLKYVLEGRCCIGTCSKPSAGTDWTSIIIVIMIVVILGVIGFFVYKKMKLKKETSSDVMNDRTKEFEERFKPQESRGNLTRI